MVASLLLWFISMFACLDLGLVMLCALHGLVLVGLWGYLLVWLHLSLLWIVWMLPFVRHTSVVFVCLIHTFLCSAWCLYGWLAFFVPPVWLSVLLCIFVRLPTCSCMSLCVVHSPISWNYGYSIQTYISPSRTPSFVWQHARLTPFDIFCYLVFEHAFLLFVALLVCWLFSFVITWTLGVGCDLLDTSKRARMQARRCKPTKGNVQ